MKIASQSHMTPVARITYTVLVETLNPVNPNDLFCVKLYDNSDCRNCCLKLAATHNGINVDSVNNSQWSVYCMKFFQLLVEINYHLAGVEFCWYNGRVGMRRNRGHKVSNGGDVASDISGRLKA